MFYILYGILAKSFIFGNLLLYVACSTALGARYGVTFAHELRSYLCVIFLNRSYNKNIIEYSMHICKL